MNNIKIRLASVILDCLIIPCVLVIIASIIFIFQNLAFGHPEEQGYPLWLEFSYTIFYLLIFSTFFNKDAIRGKSPAKKILNLIVVNNKTGRIATPINSVIRNLTIIIAPIELIFIFFSPERRIGDYIAGTKVINDNKKLNVELKKSQVLISQIIGLIIFISTLLFIKVLADRL